MKNYVQRGDILTVTAPTGGVSSGDGVQVGNLFGVAAFDAAEGADVELAVEGVFNLPKVTADDLAVGDTLYWDDASGKLSSTQGSADIKVGLAVAAAGNGVTTVDVKLAPGVA